MPNTKSAIRRVRRVKRQTQINRIRKSKYKNAVKQMDLLIKSKDKTKTKKGIKVGKLRILNALIKQSLPCYCFYVIAVIYKRKLR